MASVQLVALSRLLFRVVCYTTCAQSCRFMWRVVVCSREAVMSGMCFCEVRSRVASVPDLELQHM